MNYLAHRSGSANFYYREAVPADLRELLARQGMLVPREVWKTLGTADPKLAKGKLAEARAEQHRQWDSLRKFDTKPSALPSSFEMALAVAKHVHENFLEHAAKELRARIEAGLDLATEAQRRRDRIAREALRPSIEDQAGLERFAGYVCKEERWPITPADHTTAGVWSELVELVRKAVQNARADIVDTLEGRQRKVSQEQVVARLGVEPELVAKPGETLMELFGRYENELHREGTKKMDTIATERKVLAHFASFAGPSRSVTTIGPEDIREFKRALSVVPERWTARPELKGLSIGDAARKWEATGGSGRSPTTIRRELSAVSTFFRWMKTNAYYSAPNPTTDFFPKVDKKKNKYPPYSPEQLTAVFSSPLFHKCIAKKPHLVGNDLVRDWRYWLPLCAFFTGARAGEIAQLLCSDVREVAGTWMFDLNEDANYESTEAGKSLKTASSRREVPIHPMLIRLGFLKHVDELCQDGTVRLFPEIKQGPRGNMSHEPSKFWQRYLQRIGVKRHGLALHSFRHTFVNECRDRGVAHEVTQALLGHSDGSQTGHYGSVQAGNREQRRSAIYSLSFGGIGNGLPEPFGCDCQGTGVSRAPD